jgi:hypothetical protein
VSRQGSSGLRHSRGLVYRPKKLLGSETYCKSFQEVFERDVELSLDFEMREI